jgi:hypothetical protein
MSVQAYVWWSIYVRTSTVRKLKEVHLPPISDAIEALEFDWLITTEDDAPGLFRLVTYQNLHGESSADVIVPVLRRAYRLANSWWIQGLRDLADEQLHHVVGGWSVKTAANRPPALESMMFEMQPGQISGMTDDGGWQVVGAASG